jgi:uncharacterized protein YjbI with pentapeptide repeats
MDVNTLRRILTAFADSPANIDLSRGTLVVEIRDEIIEARLTLRQGALFVVENDVEFPAPLWIVNRIARLPLLAERILAYLPDERFFVTSGGDLLDQLDASPDDLESYVEDASLCITEVLGRRLAGTASVMYLTSDAGEGKTTLINHLAKYQAQQYKEKKQDWLLLPVSLGGRTFMRFDDVITGALVNRLRFSFLYYDAFIELVKLGVIVPAFDGFEEMFVEGSSGDAISALGNLVNTLQSSGAVLIAARKAYFEYKNLHTQTKLFDSLGGQSVTFSRLSLRRWDKPKFLQYAQNRGDLNGEQLYSEFAEQLGPSHPLLTRAVLVRRLLDVTSEMGDRALLLTRILNNPNDYFRQFIGSIVSREAKEKWIDKLGEVARPLISENEHYELLSLIALEMWINGTEYLRADIFEFVSEMFSDSKRKDKLISRQVSERIKQHALIIKTDPHQFGFDHQEFFHFFLGEGIGKLLLESDIHQIKHCLKQNNLPLLSIESAANFIRRAKAAISEIIRISNNLIVSEPRASYVKDNLGAILIRLLDSNDSDRVLVSNGTFPPDSLLVCNLNNTEFVGCYFQGSSISNSIISNCTFRDCEFESLELGSNTEIFETILVNCDCRAILPFGSDVTLFAPLQVMQALLDAGFSIPIPEIAPQPLIMAPEENIVIVNRLLRAFLRSTGLNENTLKNRLGSQSSHFFREVLPVLLTAGLLEEVSFRGSGNQKRFQLGVSLERLTRAVESCGGSFENFVVLATER